ncbi:hypothetical protein SOVF_084340 [Spinacia oleracea]|nr:hypothetical protein SOVF_084340 [Spinacia oleracea]
MFSVLKMLEKTFNELFYMHPISFSFPSFILFVFFLYKWLFTDSSKIQNLPPSPPKLPILGHLPKLGELPHRTLKSWSERYGELMLIYLGGKPTLVVSSAKVAKEIMKTHDAVISNRGKFSINDKLFYNSRDVAASCYGEYWRQMKSIFVLQLLSSKRVRSFRGIREEETASLMEKIRQSNASVVNLSAMFMVLTNDVVCRVAFGRKYSTENHQHGEGGVDFKVVLKEFVELLGTFNVGDFVPWLGWVNRFNGLNAKVERVSKSFDLLLEEILTEHSDRLNRTGYDNDDENGGKDFVDVLLQLQKENSIGFPLERESIKALVMVSFMFLCPTAPLLYFCDRFSKD